MTAKRFVLIVDGRVHEHFEIPEGTPPISERFHPDFVAQMIDTTGLIFQPPQGWLYDEKTGAFAMPLAQDGTTPIAPLVAGGEDLREIVGGNPMRR